MKVAIIGTVGVPANYGGFETLVEQLIRHNDDEELQFAVYCSKKSYSEKRWVYQGAKTEYVNFKANGIQSIIYDIISLIKASRKSDVILVLGVSGCSFLPVFRIFSKKKLIINIDGLEHKRDKWNKWIKKFLKYSEKKAIKYGNIIIGDNKGINDYVRTEYGIESEFIPYGGDHVFKEVSSEEIEQILNKYSVSNEEYALGICRIEPENNVHLILDAFEKSKKKIIFIGNWDKSEYGINLKNKYLNSSFIKINPAVYDIKELNVLRSNCSVYLHGHSAGGTNPSLVEAMFFNKPIFAYDCIYNRETTFNKANYFTSSSDLKNLLSDRNLDLKENADSMRKIAEKNYKWKDIAVKYQTLFFK